MAPAESYETAAEALQGPLTGTLILAGKPMTWARVRTRGGQFFTKPDRAARMGDFAQRWIDQKLPRFARGIWLAAEFEFVFARPASHYGTGRNADLLKASAPAFPGRGTNGGDLDNLEKLAKDGLNGVAYHDDSQIVRKDFSTKRWAGPGETPHTRVTLRAIS